MQKGNFRVVPDVGIGALAAEKRLPCHGTSTKFRSRNNSRAADWRSSSSADLKPPLDLFVFVSTARTETGDELP
jgi:hypothetical protein